MPHQFSALTFTPRVQAMQEKMGSRFAGQKLTERGPANDILSEAERHFIAERDSFYMATVTETGWPYIQHRGGPKGFLHILDDHTLAFADLIGNRQYITTGNLTANDRVALFLMDYPHQTRLKLLAHAEVLPWDAHAFPMLPLPPRSTPERVVKLHLAAFDWNCPQHITPRWTANEIEGSPVERKVSELLSENERLRAELAALRSNAPID